jgi:two-component system, chemotaxis family, protein-glutamate methylesterase/glutaminase
MDGLNGTTAARPQGTIKVLVCDDSAFMRYVISKELSVDPAIEVIGTARDGLDAMEKIAQLKPDVVTMDLEMPRMDGLTALDRIMKEQPVPVILLSSLTQEGASVTIRGLELGAVDFEPKPSAVQATASEFTWQHLIAKVKHAGSMDARRLRRRTLGGASPAGELVRPLQPRLQPASGATQPATAMLRPSRSPGGRVERVLIIGTSTGGPRALFEVVPKLPANLPAAVLLVQHMPPGFTKSLANRLNDVSRLEVREAVEGDVVETGVALLAPGDFHMTIRKGGRVALEKTPPLHGVRPSVDITMESAAALYPGIIVGVVLTGMGMDGTRGAIAIRRAGGTVMTEDEATCVVYGMPRSVKEAGASDRVVRLEGMADAIVEALSSTTTRENGYISR